MGRHPQGAIAVPRAGDIAVSSCAEDLLIATVFSPPKTQIQEKASLPAFGDPIPNPDTNVRCQNGAMVVAAGWGKSWAGCPFAIQGEGARMQVGHRVTQSPQGHAKQRHPPSASSVAPRRAVSSSAS